MRLSAEEIRTQTLSAETLRSAVEQVRINGYVLFEEVIPRDRVKTFHDAYHKLFVDFVEKTKDSQPSNKHIQMYLPFDAPFSDLDVIANPFVLPILDEILGADCACRYFASNTPLPGSTHQQTHSDLGALFPEANITLPPTGIVLNIPLVDVNDVNGPMDMWPGGSHLVPESLNKSDIVQRTAESMVKQPGTMPAGSLFIRDMRMWHRGALNRSDGIRPNIALVYFRSWYDTRPKIKISWPVYDGLSDRAKQLFRFEDIEAKPATD